MESAESTAVSPIKVGPLRFEFVDADESRITYRAIVIGSNAAGEVVFALTAVTATPESSEEAADLQAFLAQLEGGFRITGPEVGKPPSEYHQPLPFNPKEEILLMPELISVKGVGLFEVGFSVKSVIRESVAPDAARPPGVSAGEPTPGSLSQGKKQQYKTAKHRRLNGTVACQAGQVGMRPGPAGKNGFVTVEACNTGGVTSRRTRKITVKGEGGDYTSDFTISAGFYVYNPAIIKPAIIK